MSTLNLENIKHPDSASNNISVDSSGRTGVGTASPSATLHVEGGSNTQMRVSSTGAEANLTLNGGSYAQINNTTGTLYVTNDTASDIEMRTASTTRLKVDGSGRVTMPYQPSFHAYVSGSYSASAVNELVKFNGTTFNTGNHFDISAGNHKFVAPVDGVYSFQSTVNTYSVGVGSILRAEIYINGSVVSRGDYMVSDHTGDQNVSIAITRSLSTNDYVQIYHVSDDASRGFSGGGTWVWFSGFLVG